MPHHQALQSFLIDHFRPHNLRQLFAALPNARDLLDDLPGGSPSPNEFTFEAVEVLRKHGAIDRDFWKQLKARRPRLKDRVEALQASFSPLASASSPTLSLVLARASRRPRYTEIELAVHNHSTQPQLLKELRLVADNITVDYTPQYKFTSKVQDDRLLIALDNRGWSDLSLDLDVETPSGSSSVPRKIISPRVLSGEQRTLAAFAPPELFPGDEDDRGGLHVHGRCHVHALNEEISVGESFGVSRSDFSGRLTASCPCAPDTTYVCLFETTAASSQKRYDILREVPAGQIDVFACQVSADRSASFDLVLELLSTDETPLSTRHNGLAVTREPRESSDIKDGEIFTRGRDGSWHLDSRFRRPRYL